MNTRTVYINDNSIASLSGASQQLVPMNMDRSFIHIFNNGLYNIGVNMTGGVAAIGSVGTDTVVPNGSITYSIGSVPGNAVNVIGTSGQPVVCWTSP